MRDDAVFRRARLVFEDIGRQRIARAPGRRLVGHLLEHPGHVVGDGGLHPVEATGVHVHRRPAVHEDVVLDEGIAPAADRRGVGHVAEQVAGDAEAGCTVVQVDAQGAAVARPEDVVEVVVADDVALPIPAPAGVEGAHVAGLVADAVQLVQLDDVVVAAEEDAVVRAVVDQVVRDSLAYSVHQHARPVSALQARIVEDVVVVGVVAGSRQRPAVAAVQGDPALGGIVDVAAHHAVGAPAHGHAAAARVADGAADDLAAGAARHRHRGAACGFQGQATKGNEGGVLHCDKGR